MHSLFFSKLYLWVLKLGKLDHFIVAEGLQKELLNMVIQEIFRAFIFTCCKAIHDIIHESLWRINILAPLQIPISLLIWEEQQLVLWKRVKFESTAKLVLSVFLPFFKKLLSNGNWAYLSKATCDRRREEKVTCQLSSCSIYEHWQLRSNIIKRNEICVGIDTLELIPFNAVSSPSMGALSAIIRFFF